MQNRFLPRCVLILSLTLVVIGAGILFIKNLPSLVPILKPPPADIAALIASGNQTDFPLTLPADFSIEVFAENLPGARVMLFDSLGNLWVSQSSQGTVSLVEIENGKPVRQTPIFTKLNRPHGLALDPLDPFKLYIAEEHRLSEVRIYSEGEPQTLAELPANGNHYTRTSMFLPASLSADGTEIIGNETKMLISVGSSCNVCLETDDRRAKVLLYDTEAETLTEYARGLRNAVFMAIHPVTGDIWATEMGRDLLGDDIPPDEVNIIGIPSLSSGQNLSPRDFGWPFCYGKNTRDMSFAPSGSPDDCASFTSSHLDIQAHSAPLGIAFIPEEGWPESMWYDAIIAYHGSWNRSVPTGYKLVRFPLDATGNPKGEPRDFITGWLRSDGALGRPVDIIIQSGGVMYLSDDKAGIIYKITYTPNHDEN